MVNENLFKAQTLEEAEIVPWPVWLHWLEDHLIHQNVGGSIPGQGTYLGCRFYPWSGVCMEGNQPILLSLPLPFSFSLYLPGENKGPPVPPRKMSNTCLQGRG